MDIKKEIEKVFKSITGDSSMLEAFKKNPVQVVTKIVGESVGSEVINKIVAGVKAKLAGDKAAGIAGALGGLFKK